MEKTGGFVQKWSVDQDPTGGAYTTLPHQTL